MTKKQVKRSTSNTVASTPGPWALSRLPEATLIKGNTRPNPDGWGTISDNVCMIPDTWLATRSEATNRANARLIAAAPDLLSELKNLHSVTFCPACDENERGCRTLALIEKAEGK